MKTTEWIMACILVMTAAFTYADNAAPKRAMPSYVDVALATEIEGHPIIRPEKDIGAMVGVPEIMGKVKDPSQLYDQGRYALPRAGILCTYVTTAGTICEPIPERFYVGVPNGEYLTTLEGWLKSTSIERIATDLSTGACWTTKPWLIGEQGVELPMLCGDSYSTKQKRELNRAAQNASEQGKIPTQD